MQGLLERGIRRACMTIAITNISSYRAAEKGGAQRIGVIFAQRRFGKWISSYMPLIDEHETVTLA
jgi:hypothetical protein